MKRVTYEWCVEAHDEYGDAEDLRFATTLQDAIAMSDANRDDGYTDVFLLIRREEKPFQRGGFTELTAYLDYGCDLPEYFKDANEDDTYVKVPLRFHKEVSEAGWGDA